jgi:dipeptidyl aminopeptidase/acylaminoacyl peptidase
MDAGRHLFCATVWFIRWLCLGPALLGAAFLAAAPMDPAALLSVRQIRDLSASPDQAAIAFTVVDPPKGRQSPRNIWLYRRAADKAVALTSSGRDGSPRWSPDSARLAFLSSRSGSNQIFLLPPPSGDPVPLTAHSGGIQTFEWSPDGKEIAFLAAEPEKPALAESKSDEDDARVVSVVGGGGPPTRIWIFDVASKTERQLSAGPYDVSSLAWQPDAAALVVTALDRPETDRYTARIYRVSVRDGSFTEIPSPRGPVDQVRVSPDGKTIAFVGAHTGGPIAQDLYIVPSSGGSAVNLSAGVDRPVGQFVWKDNATLEVMFESGFSNRMYIVDTAGKCSPIAGLDAGPSQFAALREGVIAYIHEGAAELPEVWLWSPGHGARVITGLNAEWKPALAQPEFIRYQSSDGIEIEAELLKPEAPSGTRFPTVFLFHGGPIGRWSDRFDAEGQLLVSRGYAVLYPNIRGATGYGHRMIEMILSQPLGGEGWATGPFRDVLAGADALVARGVADPQRLAVGGWSYGGYLSAWALAHSDRFKTAVAGAGVYDMFNDLGTEIASYVPGDEWNYGVFFEDRNREAMYRDSPITYAKNIHAPILLLHGEQDPVDTIGQAYAFYRALKRYGAMAEFVVYPREGHALREQAHLLDRLNRTIEWYDKYLKNAGTVAQR